MFTEVCVCKGEGVYARAHCRICRPHAVSCVQGVYIYAEVRIQVICVQFVYGILLCVQVCVCKHTHVCKGAPKVCVYVQGYVHPVIPVCVEKP